MDVNAEINGWKIFVHPCFSSQLEALIEEVEVLKEKYPEGFQKKAATKLLAAVLKVIHSEICADPTQVKFRQGSTLGDANKHWFRAKFLMQYRLFFRYSEPHKTIILAWINDAETKRAYGSKRDAYKVFATMLASGHPPSDWDELLGQSRVDHLFIQGVSQR
ncbi:type II toxin-antitoxin system YhaV family toxin [Pantoea rwandensis]|uniref:Toxin YhaV n=1 Tax=Pantoea rwandensis TaxID=1076550 RepID=A0A1X1CUJ4_9GAMM|nr:type II toxin-antitoxin system YhaV family toxin [Pantoea rwandensis]ORM68088.1 toxin YhaV [Pantoea rwandensis]